MCWFTTFNSLSRDHLKPEARDGRQSDVAFNSLSRDHAFLELVDSAQKTLSFQLPLSGSPSPIPGFFGSPRLSAAAPLRTNDF